MEPIINVKGKVFKLVTVQRDGKTGVYRSDGEFLRIGEKEKIKKDMELHKKMESSGVPVAKLISEGELNGQYYFLESSLGEQHLGKLFVEDARQKGTISDEHFNLFLDIVERFGKTQLKTKVETKNFNDFGNGIHLDILYNELPQYQAGIKTYFECARERLSAFPFVITHGDFNPNNLYPAGVIDLEDSFYGPFGYDLISALVHINYFPDSQEYEYFARYRFTQPQKEKYIALLDSLSTEVGLPPLSKFETDFEFCRGIWSLVRMHQWPKIQKFRYNLFIEKFLNN